MKKTTQLKNELSLLNSELQGAQKKRDNAANKIRANLDIIESGNISQLDVAVMMNMFTTYTAVVFAIETQISRVQDEINRIELEIQQRKEWR